MLRPGALGDTLLTLPALRALRALRRRFGPLTLAAHGGAARLLATLGEVDRGLAFDEPSLGWVFSGDRVPDDPIVAWMSPVPALRRALLVAPSRPVSDTVHCAQYLLETLAGLGVETTPDVRPFKVDPRVSGEVLIHPGSGSTAKNWPAARFADTIGALDGPVRLIVGEADGEAADAVEACLGRAMLRLEHTPLEELAAWLAGCRAYLGNDSGVSHLAGLCGARTVVLFGPSSPTVWRPLGPDVHVASFETSPRRAVALLEGVTGCCGASG